MSRHLCAFGAAERRHCQRPGERNVFDHSAAPTSSSASPTSAPTASAAPSSSAFPTSIGESESRSEFPDTCVSDGGDFGETDSSKAYQIVTVWFNYQVQTTIQLRAESLNSVVLAQLEEALANLLVPPLFNGNELCEFDRRRNLQSNLAPAVGLLSAPADRILMGSEGGTSRDCLEYTRMQHCHCHFYCHCHYL
jgi:hypothetical protein